MWTKNGEKTLPYVLKRINTVIPASAINRKIAIDDNSADATRALLEFFGWQVVTNEKGGIANAANQALQLVETPVFFSFEQDVILAKNWFDVIPRRLGGDVKIASGVRFANKPDYLRKLQTYSAKQQLADASPNAWVKARKKASFTIGKTLDNTAYETAALRDIGGFPKMATISGVDTVLSYRLLTRGLDWAVDFSVKSVHVRLGGLFEEMRHQRGYASEIRYIWRQIDALGIKQSLNTKGVLAIWFKLGRAPFAGLQIAIAEHDPRIIIGHVCLMLSYLIGYTANPKFKGVKKK